jgi:hypothetical protein
MLGFILQPNLPITHMTDLQSSTQQLSVVANFLNVEEAWDFFNRFESNFSCARICSRTFRPYPKFKYSYWFDWVLVVEDINAARDEIRNCFGDNWIISGGEEIWNAENKQELLVPFWAILSEPNSMSLQEADLLNPEPQMQQSEAFVSVSTRGEITGDYSLSIFNGKIIKEDKERE